MKTEEMGQLMKKNQVFRESEREDINPTKFRAQNEDGTFRSQ